MWILHFLPDSVILWFCNILLLTGIALTVAGLFAHRIPLVWQYQLPFKIAGIALLVLGVYFRGGYSVEMAWRERVAEVEAKLAVAEKQSAEANQKIDARSQKQTVKIRERTQYIRQYVDREVVKYDAACTIPQPFIRAHNDAAEAPKK
jgi:type VI protein secretion system component VasK